MRGLLVGNRAPPAFKEQALGSRRAERASSEKADRSEQANQTPRCARGVRVAIFLCTKGILESGVQWDHPNSLVVLHYFRRVFAGMIFICVFEISIAQRMFRSPANNRALKTQSPILLPRPEVACCGCQACEAPRRGPRVGVSSKNGWG